MTQIVVTTDGPGGATGEVLLRERIAPADLDSDHTSGQLVERIGWALSDAEEIERRRPADEAMQAAAR